MSTEDEEYYDSIDNDELSQCRSFCNEKFHEEESEIDETSYTNKIKNMIPFYTGNVDKSEVESIKNESKSTSLATFKNNNKFKKYSVMSLADQKKNRSYLTIFYAKKKNSFMKSQSNITSCRATCSELTPNQRLTQNQQNDKCRKFCKSKSPITDGESSRFIESPTSSPLSKYGSSVTQNCYKSDSATTVASSKLFSVSEAHFNSLMPSREQPKRNNNSDKPKNLKKSKPFNNKLIVGELGNLGPNNIANEKLELLRKRQNYGKTVNEINRLKMMEKKVLRRLNEEIKESHKI